MTSADFLSTQLLHDVGDAAQCLQLGELVAFPTETVYGLGANALDAHAVARIFAAKQRPRFDPLIVHLPHVDRLPDVACDFPSAARKLANAFWPGPLTLVLPKIDRIPDLVTAGLPTVGVRVPDHPVALELLNEASIPIAAPSANLFGSISPTTAQHVLDGLDGRIHAVLDGGTCRIGLESTIVAFPTGKPLILRLGGLTLEDIESVIGPVNTAQPDPDNDNAAQPAPGMLSRHYAPQTPLVLFGDEDRLHDALPNAGLLTWGTVADTSRWKAIRILSATENLPECAANFFTDLRSLDSLRLDVIMARRFPGYGLGRALNDRLARAAGDRGFHSDGS